MLLRQFHKWHKWWTFLHICAFPLHKKNRSLWIRQASLSLVLLYPIIILLQHWATEKPYWRQYFIIACRSSSYPSCDNNLSLNTRKYGTMTVHIRTKITHDGMHWLTPFRQLHVWIPIWAQFEMGTSQFIRFELILKFHIWPKTCTTFHPLAFVTSYIALVTAGNTQVISICYFS